MTELLLNSAISVLQLRWNNLLSDREACLRHGDADAVHDLRVSTRRLRAALDLFGPLCKTCGEEVVRNEIRNLTRQIGELRNLDECLMFFSQQNKEAVRKRHKALFSALVKELNSLRTKELYRVRKLLSKLDKDLVEQIVYKYCNFFANADTSNIGKLLSLPGFLSESGVRLYSEIYKFLPPSCTPQDVEQRHALRITIKQWRYFLEIVAEISRQDYSHNLELLKDYQTVLGNLNDLEVFSELAYKYGLHGDERIILRRIMDERRDVYLSKLKELSVLKPLRYEFFI